MEESPAIAARVPELRSWVERLTGGEVVEWHRLVAGNSRTTWSADVVAAGERTPLVVRVDTGDGPFSDTPLTLAREAAIYADMQDRGVAVPRTYGYDDRLGAVVLERVDGEPAWGPDVLSALLEQLAHLHTVDLVDLRGGWAEPAAIADLELWAAIAERRVEPRSPFVDFAVPFLRERFPGEPERLVVVHGDSGPGNLLWARGRITGLLDWELAHIGDPHDDLAFLSVRAALHGIDLDDFGRHVRERYAAHAHVVLDEGRLRYWQAVGVLRNLITCLASISNPVRGRDRLVHYLLAHSLERLLVDSLARIEGVELEPAVPPRPAPPLPGTDVVREIADEMTEVIAALSDDEARQRVRRMRYLLGQLVDTWSLAPELARQAEADGPKPGEDATAALERLSRSADRTLALFPRGAALASARMAGFG